MSASRRFFTVDGLNNTFIFKIDTRNIVSGATNGSENPLTFRLPLSQFDANNAFIIKVSDGRADVSVTSSSGTDVLILNFATSGVYTITLIGRVGNFTFQGSYAGSQFGYDRLKIISIDRWSSTVGWGLRCFLGCSNLSINATNTIVLPQNAMDFFVGIKGFNSSLLLIDTSKVTSNLRMINSISTVLHGQLNPFWQSLVIFEAAYAGNTFDTTVDKIEITSNTLESLETPWDAVVFQNTGTIELICDTPNLKKMFRVFRNGQVRTRCHAGRIDVRNVTNPSTWITGSLTTAQTDATLLGWANNLPFMQSGITWDWKGSKYSNNPQVIAAYNKITTQWGVIFTNLTMA